MKKFILIIALGALNAFAIDCLRSTFDIFIKDYPTSTEPTIAYYKNFLVDSIYIQQGYSGQPPEYETNKYYYTGSYVDSARVYTKKKGSDDWEIKVQDHESLNYGALDVKITITQEGDFKIIRKEGKGNPPIIEYVVYEDKDSVFYVKSYVEKNGEKTNSYLYNYYISNDTLYQFNDGKNTFIVQDSTNENKCYEYGSSTESDFQVSYEYEMRGDTLTATEKKHGDNQRTITIFLVPSEKYSSTVSSPITSATRRLKLNPAKSKDFDLLGRPAKNKHIAIFKH